MSSTGEYNGWCIVTGEDFRERFFVKDPTLDPIDNPDYDSTIPESVNNPKQLFQPKDLTNYSAKMDIREGEGFDSALIISLTEGDGITLGDPDPTDGSVELFIDSTVTAVDPILGNAGKLGYYDFFLISDVIGEDNERILKGKIAIEKATTDVS